jgi:DNA-binding phage protein
MGSMVISLVGPFGQLIRRNFTYDQLPDTAYGNDVADGVPVRASSVGAELAGLCPSSARLKGQGAGTEPWWGDGDTPTPMGSMVSTVMAAMAQMEREVTRERTTDLVATRRAAGKDLGGRRQTFKDPQIRDAVRLIDGGEPTTQVARDLGMSRATLYRWIRELSELAACGSAGRRPCWGMSRVHRLARGPKGRATAWRDAVVVRGAPTRRGG